MQIMQLCCSVVYLKLHRFPLMCIYFRVLLCPRSHWTLPSGLLYSIVCHWAPISFTASLLPDSFFRLMPNPSYYLAETTGVIVPSLLLLQYANVLPATRVFCVKLLNAEGVLKTKNAIAKENVRKNCGDEKNGGEIEKSGGGSRSWS